MRTLTAREIATLRGGRMSHPSRVKIVDSGGTTRDLSSLFNRDWLVSWSLDHDIDQPVAKLDVMIARETGRGYDSNSPLRTDTRAYKLNNAPLITNGTEIVLEVAVVPAGAGATSGDWHEMFRGYVEDFDFGKNPMRITAFDLGVKLQKLPIVADKQYSSMSMQALIDLIIKDAHGIPWSTGTAVVAQSGTTPGTIRTPITDGGADNAFYYRCTTSGTTHATTEPTWPTTIGATVSDNTAVWTCEGAVPRLWVPTPPGFTMNSYVQAPMPVMDAIKAIADIIGWDLRYTFRESSGKFELRLSAPVRTSPSVAYTYDKDHYFKDPSFKADRSTVRNSVTVVYSDASDTDNVGKKKRKTVTVQDWASMLAFTNKLPAHCTIAEGATSPIDSSGEATDLANRVLSDLKDPKVEAKYMVPMNYAIELMDYLAFTGDNVLFTATQNLAVTGVTHTGNENGSAQSSLRTRGIPASAVKGWLAKEAGVIVPVRTLSVGAPSMLAPFVMPSGVILSWSHNDPNVVLTEVHVSSSNGFTPSSSTIFVTIADARINYYEITGLATGTWYFKLITRDRYGNTSPASSQQSATVGAWQTFSFSNNWSDVTSLSGAGYEAAGWRHDPIANALQFRGFIWRTTGTPSGSETVATLPVPARPLARKLLWAYGETAAAAPGAATFRFQTTGVLEWRGGTGYDGWISLFNWFVPLG